MVRSRHLDIIWLLLKSPMDSEMIFRASANFRIPYTSIGNLRNDILLLHEQGFINRQAIPSTSRGQKRFLYFPNKRIKRLPQFSDMYLTNAAFRGFSGSQWHSEATSEFVSYFEHDAGALKPRIKIHASIRDGYFKAPLKVDLHNSEKTTSLIPDYTLVPEIDGEPSLLFLEMFNTPALINPFSPQSVGRSVRFKMFKYKTFRSSLQKHPVIEDLQNQFGHRFHGFRVLMVTTQDDSHLKRLLSCAKKDGYQTMFYFSTMDQIRSSNLFTDNIWSLPNSTQRGLIDAPPV